MEEYHIQNVGDVGIAWNENRVWVCINGQSVFRAKVVGRNGSYMLMTEFYEPTLEGKVEGA